MIDPLFVNAFSKKPWRAPPSNEAGLAPLLLPVWALGTWAPAQPSPALEAVVGRWHA